jgi:hypothetical protein
LIAGRTYTFIQSCTLDYYERLIVPAGSFFIDTCLTNALPLAKVIFDGPWNRNCTFCFSSHHETPCCWCTVQFFSSDDVVGGFFIIAIMDFPKIAVQSVRGTPSADIIWPTS